MRKLSVGLVPIAFLFLVNLFSLSAQAEMISGLEEGTSKQEDVLIFSTVEVMEPGEKEYASELTGLNMLLDSEQLSQIDEADLALSEEKQEFSRPSLEPVLEHTGSDNQTELEPLEPELDDSSIEPFSLPVEVSKEVVGQPVSHYTTEDGDIREIIWAQGVTPASMEQGGTFKKEVTGEFIEYSMPYEAGNGYYDANKSLNASLEDLNLCFAAVSSNMLHWWLEQNSDYVDRFIEEKYGSEPSQQDYALTDLRRFTHSFEDQQNSRIFNLFKAYYGHRLNGFVSDALVDLFINGYSPKSQGGVNLENPDLVPDKRGGFFHEVFKEKKLTDRMFSGNYHYFGNLVRTNLENQGLLGLSYRTFGTTTHIVTVWGAEYDEQGQIRAVYITDSDDQHDPIGLKRMGITRDSSGNPRLNNNVVKHSVGSYLDYVHTINLGQNAWETYFNPIKEAQQLARQKLTEEKGLVLQAIRKQEEFSDKEERAYLALIEEKYEEGLEQINHVTDSQALTEVLKVVLQSLRIPMQSLGQAPKQYIPLGQLVAKGSSVFRNLPQGHLSVKGPSTSYALPLGDISVNGSSVNHVLPLGDLSIKGSSVSHVLPFGDISVKGSSVRHVLPLGELSITGSSVSHVLPLGELSITGSSVSHVLPLGDISVTGSSVSHVLPLGDISVKGSSVSHVLPLGELSITGSSVSHVLPLGDISVNGSSVSHILPLGDISVTGSSVSHVLPLGDLSITGSSVSHVLPLGDISVTGSSVSHVLPLGDISVNGSSVSHVLPLGDISVTGSSVSHVLPLGNLSLTVSAVAASLLTGATRSDMLLLSQISLVDGESLEDWSVESEESWLGNQLALHSSLDGDILTSPLDGSVENEMKGEEHILYSSEVTVEEGSAERKEASATENDFSSNQKENQFGFEAAKDFIETVIAGENELVSLPNIAVVVLLITAIVSYWLLASSIFKRD
ncbi:TPA: IdeS/Mac family cysteine endopeptidase [Streptococcus suis]